MTCPGTGTPMGAGYRKARCPACNAVVGMEGDHGRIVAHEAEAEDDL